MRSLNTDYKAVGFGGIWEAAMIRLALEIDD